MGSSWLSSPCPRAHRSCPVTINQPLLPGAADLEVLQPCWQEHGAALVRKHRGISLSTGISNQLCCSLTKSPGGGAGSRHVQPNSRNEQGGISQGVTVVAVLTLMIARPREVSLQVVLGAGVLRAARELLQQQNINAYG